MSRIGKLKINIPSQVTVTFIDQVISISGPHGKLTKKISDLMILTITEKTIILTPVNNSRQARALFGLSRTLINNMVIGVCHKFERRLEMKGVGYRSQIQNNTIILNLGYSHQIVIPIPTEIEVLVESNVNLIITGIDKESVGQLAALIRSKRKPEPYKGKGILYKGEIIKRKVGKSGK